MDLNEFNKNIINGKVVEPILIGYYNVKKQNDARLRPYVWINVGVCKDTNGEVWYKMLCRNVVAESKRIDMLESTLDNIYENDVLHLKDSDVESLYLDLPTIADVKGLRVHDRISYFVDQDYSCSYWLKDYINDASFVSDNGSVIHTKRNVCLAVRPAVWIRQSEYFRISEENDD